MLPYNSFILYITYHLVWNYKKSFGIHVNTQTVVTFLDIDTYVYGVFTYVPVTYHSYPTYIQRHMVLVHVIAVLQIGNTSFCCLLP